MGNFLNNLISGARFFLQGIACINKPGLRRYFVIPLMLNILVFGLLTYFGFSFFQDALGRLLPEGDAIWVDIANVLAIVIFTPVLLIAVYLVASILANFIASPFNDLLSEQVEKIAGAASQPDKSFMQVLAGMGPVLAGEIRKYIYFGLFYIPIGIITFIPPINVLVAPVAWVVFGAWMLALEYLAFPMQNHQLPFSQVRAFARKNRMRTMGFGLIVLLATLIPLVNFIVIPAAVAGATLLWVNTGKDEKSN